MRKQKILLIFLILSSTMLIAQENDQANGEELSEEAKLANATQNPLAAMYSLPFQNNTTFGVFFEKLCAFFLQLCVTALPVRLMSIS